MTKQEAQQKFNEDLITELKSTPFPAERVKGIADYPWIRDTLLEKMPLASLQAQFPLTTSEYIDLVKKTGGFTLFETQIINTLILSSAPNVIGSLHSYTDAVHLATEIGEVYNELVKPITEAIKTRIELMGGVKGLWGQRQETLKIVN